MAIRPIPTSGFDKDIKICSSKLKCDRCWKVLSKMSNYYQTTENLAGYRKAILCKECMDFLLENPTLSFAMSV